MTIEEAIEVIQKFIGWFKSDSRVYKALEMAVKALTQKTCSGILRGQRKKGFRWITAS